MTTIPAKAAATAREDGKTVAAAVLQQTQHDPTIALAVLGCAVSEVLFTVPNHDERAALLTEFIEALEDTE